MLRAFVAGPPEYVNRVKVSVERYSNISIPYTASAPSHAIEILERGVDCHVLLLGFSEPETKELLSVAIRYGQNIIPFVSVTDILTGYTTWTPYRARPILEGTEANALYNLAVNTPEIEKQEYIPQDTEYRTRIVHQKTQKDVVVIPSKVISFFDFKGGVGKTTLTVAVAKSVAALTSKRVCICDLDVSRNYGDVIKYLNLEEHKVKHTMVSWENFPYNQKNDWEIVRNHLLEVKENLYILPGIGSITNIKKLKPDLILKILEVLRKHFTLIVFDLGNSMNNLIVKVLEVTDELFLVNKPSEPEMKSLISFVNQDLPHLIDKSQVSLIYSLTTPGMKIGARDMHNSPLGISCIAEIPRDNHVELSIANNSYVPALPEDDNSFTRELEKVLFKIYPREAYRKTTKKQGFWKLFKKKPFADIKVL